MKSKPSLIKRLKAWHYWANYNLYMEQSFALSEDEEFNRVEWWCNYILQDLKYLWCEYVTGHDYQASNSHADPDSGWEEFECTRCGANQHITYY